MKKFKFLIIAFICFACIGLYACNDAQSEPDPYPSYVTPVIRIDVDKKQSVASKETYLPAVITLTDNTETVRLDAVSANVRGRGNYTWTLPKKGYRIKFDSKQKMLSDYKCKSWALLPNYTDKTLLRNYYALQMARAMDGLDWATDGKFVELYLNGKYMGVYLLCDQMQVNENRVNVEQGSVDADTGFLIERDRYAMDDPTLEEGRDYFTIPSDYFSSPTFNIKSGCLPYVLKYPEYPQRSDYTSLEEFNTAVDVYMAQFEYIKQYMTKAFYAVQNADFTEFSALCDVNSFVDYFLLDQVLANYEIDRYSSFYFHKDKDGKLVAGPVWDFDIAAGYAVASPSHGLRYCNNWFIKLGQSSPEFRKIYADRLAMHTPIFKSEVAKLADVADRNRVAIFRNNKKWPIKVPVSPMNDTLKALKTYDAQLDFFINYVNERVDHLNAQLVAWH